MTLAELWSNDWVIKLMLIAFALTLLISLEKIYQFIKAFKEFQNLKTIENIDEVQNLKQGKTKDILMQIHAFKDEKEALFNANVGIKLDIYEVHQHRLLNIISLIAVLSPMIGLIGTFIGVWHVFEGVGSVGLNDPSTIARGIKEVLIDTMAGLLMAVIAMIFYKFFEAVSNRFTSSFEERVYELLRQKRA